MRAQRRLPARLPEQVAVGRDHELARAPVAARPQPAHDHRRDTLGFAAHEVGGGGDLVGEGDLRGAQDVPRAVDRPAQVERAAARPATPIATSVVPRRNGRPNESLTITATSVPACRRIEARIRRALSSGSTGRRTTVPGSGAFDVSTPADAQTKPWRVSAITSGAARAHDALRLAQDHLDLARVAHLAGELARAIRTARRRRAARRGPPPSRRPSARPRRRRRPRAARARRSARRGRRPPRSRADPRPGRSRSRGRDAGDADAGVRLVAPVQVHDHGRQPFERARARERAGVERPAGDELRGELERELLRARVVAADEARPRRAARRRGSRPRSSGARRRPGASTSSWIRSASERASGSGRTPSFAKASALATERSGVSPSAPATARAVSSAASALTASTARSAPRTASSLLAPASRLRRAPAPSHARARGRASRSRPRPRRARRAAPQARGRSSRFRRGSRPSRGAPAASSTSRARRRRASSSLISVRVTTGRTPAGQLRRRIRLVDHERVDQARVAAGHVRRRRAAREPREHPVGRALDRTAADQRADRDARHAAPLERERESSSTARIGPIETYGLLGAITTTSAASSASSTPGRGTRIGRPRVVDGVHLVAVAAFDEPGLEREGAVGRLEERPQGRVGRREQRAAEAEGRRKPRRHLRERNALAQELRPHEVQPDVAVAEPEPRLAAEVARGRRARSRSRRHAPSRAPRRPRPRARRARCRGRARRGARAPRRRRRRCRSPSRRAGRRPRRRPAGSARRRRRPRARSTFTRPLRGAASRAPRAFWGRADPPSRSRSATVSTSSIRFGAVDGPRRRERREAVGATRPVDRREQVGRGERERVRRAVGGNGESETAVGNRAGQGEEIAGSHARQVGVHDEVGRAATGRHGRIEPDAHSRSLAASRVDDEDRIADGSTGGGDDDGRPDCQACVEDIGEHRVDECRPRLALQLPEPALARHATERNDDCRHPRDPTVAQRRGSAAGPLDQGSPEPGARFAHSRSSNQ